MNSPILIVGQGVAGTLLGWEFEQAGIDFAIADAGPAGAASQVAAGIINPITGQRLVKGAAVDRCLPRALASYRALEAAWGVAVLRELRVWREFADAREREIFETRMARHELAPYARRAEAEGARFNPAQGFWIAPAWQVDLPALLVAGRRRWQAQGRLRPERVDVLAEAARRDWVIDCTGAQSPLAGELRIERSKGELLQVDFDRAEAERRGLSPEVILNRGHWLLPLSRWADADRVPALVGATYDRAAVDLTPDSRHRATLEASARDLLCGVSCSVTDHRCGWRMAASDRRPMVGKCSHRPGVGYVNGLSSRGALYAPWLARQWVNHLTEGIAFESW